MIKVNLIVYLCGLSICLGLAIYSLIHGRIYEASVDAIAGLVLILVFKSGNLY